MIVNELRRMCRHDSRSVEGCTTCEAADEIERLRAALEVTPAPVTLEAAEWAIGVFRAKEEQMRADAARLDYIEKHARYDPKMDGNHAWWPTTFENVLRGPTLRAAIDAAMKEAK